MNRAEIAAKIRALFSKSVENGATEAEAASAAAKAKEWMDKYQLDMSALELEEEGTERRTTAEEQFEKKRSRFEIRTRICWKIGAFCEVKTWTQDSKRVVFFGLKSDVDFAEWLLDSLEHFVKKEADRYKLDHMLENIFMHTKLDVPEQLDVNGFKAGCCDKINERLAFEAAKRRQYASGSLNALVVSKDQIVKREFDKLGLRFGTGRAPGGAYRSGSGYNAGKAAGERASFGRPVSGGTLRIGKS